MGLVIRNVFKGLQVLYSWLNKVHLRLILPFQVFIRLSVRQTQLGFWAAGGTVVLDLVVIESSHLVLFLYLIVTCVLNSWLQDLARLIYWLFFKMFKCFPLIWLDTKGLCLITSFWIGRAKISRFDTVVRLMLRASYNFQFLIWLQNVTICWYSIKFIWHCVNYRGLFHLLNTFKVHDCCRFRLFSFLSLC